MFWNVEAVNTEFELNRGEAGFLVRTLSARLTALLFESKTAKVVWTATYSESRGITGHAVNDSVCPPTLVPCAMNRARVARDRMALMTRFCLLLLIFAPSFVADESSFALWIRTR